MDLSLLGAFLGGTLALLSPCSVMVLPAFFAYAFQGPSELASRTGAFFLGLATTLVPLGLLAGTLGAWVAANRSGLMTWVLVLVIVLGAVMLLGIPLPALTKQQSARGTSVASVYALGAVYGLAGGCAGPIFGAVLAMAAFGGNALMGGATMLLYAAGMTVPLALLALVWNRIPGVRKLMRPRELVIGRWRNSWSNVIGGLITIAVGVFMLATDGAQKFGGMLDASTQAGVEANVMRATAGVSDLVVLGVAAVAGLGIWAVMRWRARQRQSDASR
ncbi:cytochrome c biogenesis CcdA family protein [Leucobacter albus]|uniref:Cytochrome c biogenesis CcdA family protein n=1 Tax=Leucobacter albus TaxID=272210 RepID=A0ABW3THW8_9MICO